LVDPSRTTRLIVTRMLEAGGHEVMPFADESDALARIKADASIEALITSAELKHMSGVELCWETRLLATSRRPPDGSLSAIILDIDNFKQINDSFSHETGDEAICVCARAAFLNGAVVGRLGGDEFALLLKDRTLPQAVEIAEGVRTRLFEQSFDTGRGRIRLICSLGVGEGRAGDTIDQILARADAALYDAKLKGRNCVVGINARVPMRNAVVTEGIVRARAMA
jgi:diguanylate cyclase (GGDEF)-like protein